MDDLISRQAVIDAFYQYPNVNWTTLDVMEKINEAPHAQPEHGRWIPLNNQTAKCSLCGATESTFGKDLTGRTLIHKAVKRYCYWCGAKMDGDENG